MTFGNRTALPVRFFRWLMIDATGFLCYVHLSCKEVVMLRYKDFLLFLLGFGVVAFVVLAGFLQVHDGFVLTCIGMNVALGMFVRIVGGAGVAAIVAAMVLFASLGLPGLTVLLVLGLPLALFAWRTKIVDEREEMR